MAKPGPVSRTGLYAALMASALLLTACDSDTDNPSTPVISDLRLQPNEALQAPGQTAHVVGTIDFADGGVGSARLHVVSNSGADRVVPVSMPGTATGSLSAEIPLSLDAIGRVTFELWLESSAGRASNRLSGTFDVRANDSALRWRPAPGAAALEDILAREGKALLAGAWNGKLYVFTGANGLIVTSPDLVTWTRQDSGFTHDLPRISSVAWSGSAFVATADLGYGEGVLIRSADGINWTRTQVIGRCPPRGNPGCVVQANLNQVAWSGSQWLAVGFEQWYDDLSRFGWAWTSPDGSTWTERSSHVVPVSFGFGSIASSGVVWVATGADSETRPVVWTSTDSQTWVQRALPVQGTGQSRNVVWGLGRFVALVQGFNLGPSPPLPAANNAVTSVDGITWQARTGADPLPELTSVATGSTRYLAIGPTRWLTSTDGLQWAPAGTPSGPCGNGVFWDGSRWLAFGGSVCLSP